MLRVLPSIAGFERRAAASLALTAALSLLPLAAAAAGRTTERLEAPTSATERFGRSVALSGNLGLVGATGALDEVFFVRQTGIGWTHDGSFDSGDAPGAPGMTIVDFGLAVAIDGNVAVVGAPSTSRFSNNLFESSVGAAWVFHRVLTGSPPFVFYQWQLVKRLVPSTSGAFDRFGQHLAVEGDVIAVGAPGVSSDGAVFLFERNTGGTNAWGQSWAVDVSSASLGMSLALLEETLAVGLPGRSGVSPSVSQSGVVKVFRRQWNATWTAEATLESPVRRESGHFGRAVALGRDSSGSLPFPLLRLTVGEPAGTGEVTQPPGRAYTFSRPTHLTTWSSGAELVLPPNTDAYLYGWRVAAEGQHAIGLLPAAPYRVGVFDLSGAPRWVGSLAPHEAPSDYLYHELAMSNGVVAIGDWPAESYGLTARGAVFLGDLPLFTDDFESGGTSVWSAAVP